MARYQLTDTELARIKYPPIMDTRLLDTPSITQFIQQLTAVQRNALFTLTYENQYAAGDVIVQEGDNGEALYIIRLGKVAIIKGTYETPTILGYQGLGSVLGEMSILEGTNHSATVIAIEKVRMMQIKRDDFLHFLEEHPDVNQYILASLSAHLREADKDRQRSTRKINHQQKQIDDLIAQKEELIKTAHARMEMSDHIIHDLRNPLNLIHGATQMLEMMLPAEVLLENQGLLNIASTASARMQRLIDSLLDTSRMESGDFELKHDALNIHLVIQDIVAQMRLSLEKREIDVTLDLADDVPIIYADEAKIIRAIANLVDNAIKFMPEGGSLRIEASSQTAAAVPQILISIIDTGPGIPHSAREHIFDRYAQVDVDGKYSHYGYGLGLAFCQLAIEAHNGRIWIEDGDDGIGSRFNFTLPVNA